MVFDLLIQAHMVSTDGWLTDFETSNVDIVASCWSRIFINTFWLESQTA